MGYLSKRIWEYTSKLFYHEVICRFDLNFNRWEGIIIYKEINRIKMIKRGVVLGFYEWHFELRDRTQKNPKISKISTI